MSKRVVKHFVCARCGTVNPDFLTFGAGKHYYCLSHIPRVARAWMWLRERVARP